VNSVARHDVAFRESSERVLNSGPPKFPFREWRTQLLTQEQPARAAFELSGRGGQLTPAQRCGLFTRHKAVRASAAAYVRAVQSFMHLYLQRGSQHASDGTHNRRVHRWLLSAKMQIVLNATPRQFSACREWPLCG